MNLNLAGSSWRLQGNRPDGGNIDIACRMPGDNATALWESGLIPDPYCGRNEEQVQWIGTVPWIFSTTFSLPEKNADELYYLNFDSIDTCAAVFLNGREIGRSDNQFLRARFWVNEQLQSGENRLEIHIASPIAEAASRAAAYPYDLGQNDNNRIPHLQFLRKTQCHGGWDWGICLPVSGLYGRIELRSVRKARIEYVVAEQEWAPRQESVRLRVRVALNAPEPGQTAIRVKFQRETRTGQVSFTADGVEQEFVFDIARPRLWNPAGLGEQFMEPLEVCADEERVIQQIGLRQVELIRRRADGTPGAFGFRVNGKAVFCRGANWIPPDAMPGRMTEERLRRLIADLKEVGMNMVRVWGGGSYESDLFYDLCDQYGIMVWQDCMFACARYPDSADFLASVDRELAWQMRRLNSHPSLVLWCGDNENYACFGHTCETPEKLRSALLYDRVNRAVSASAARYSRLPWWRSSPDNGEEHLGENPWSDAAGDMHYWDVWHGGAPFSAYYGISPSFCSEFGFQSFPSLAAIHEYIQKADANLSSPEMEAHQKNGNGNARILSTFTRYFRMPDNFTETVYLSQVQQAMAVRTAVEYWRSLEPECLGTLIWQLNDNWPVTSWSMIDWTGRRKVLYYAAKHFHAPLLVTGYPAADGRIAVCAINDTKDPFRGRVVAEFRRFDGEVLQRETSECRLDSCSAGRLLEIRGENAPETGFWDLTLLDERGGEVTRNEFFAAEYKRCALPAAAISCSVEPCDDGFSVMLKSDRYAFYVFAELTETRCDWSDNAVTLRPGCAVTLQARPTQPLSQDAFVSELKVSHLGAYTCSLNYTT